MGKDETFIITPHSPYYLSPSDSPGALITAIRFDGKNYDLWEQAVKTALRAKNKLGFIDGTITKPEVTGGDESLVMANTWEMVNSMITSWIMNVIDPKLHASVAYAHSAYAIWENIRKRYSVPNIPRIHKLKAEIASCKQGNMDVVEFFSKLMSLWNELSNYIRVPECKCGAADTILQLAEQDKVHQFLMGLDDEAFATVRSQILALDKLPTIDKVFNMVQQEEAHKKGMVAHDGASNVRDAVSAFAVSHSRTSHRTGAKPTCQHCGKYGHDATGCFELIGYPPGWSTRGGRDGRSSRGRDGRGGGRAAAGRGRGALREVANVISHETGDTEDDSHKSSNLNFTPEQVQKILSLIEPSKSVHERLSGNISWLLDSGASCHMTANLDVLQEICDVLPLSLIHI